MGKIGQEKTVRLSLWLLKVTFYCEIIAQQCDYRRDVSPRSRRILIRTTVVIGRSPVLPPPPSLGPRAEPPHRVQSGWERNALGCGAAPTVGNRRENSHAMDSNDPYLHLSKYAPAIRFQSSVTVAFLTERLRFGSDFVFMASSLCELCAKKCSGTLAPDSRLWTATAAALSR